MKEKVDATFTQTYPATALGQLWCPESPYRLTSLVPCHHAPTFWYLLSRHTKNTQHLSQPMQHSHAAIITCYLPSFSCLPHLSHAPGRLCPIALSPLIPLFFIIAFVNPGAAADDDNFRSMLPKPPTHKTRALNPNPSLLKLQHTPLHNLHKTRVTNQSGALNPQNSELIHKILVASFRQSPE